MENLEQEKISKVKSKFEKEHTKISVFLRFDQIEYLNKEHVEPNCSNMSLVVRNAVDIFIEKEPLAKGALRGGFFAAGGKGGGCGRPFLA